jgi:hypothetical protein
MNIKTWSENIVKDAYREWKEKYSDYENGFKVFYSVPRKNPKLMIISFQPGGNYSHFHEENLGNYKKDDFSIKENSYISNNHKMSKVVRKLFSIVDNGIKILETSVIFPLIFFRSSSVKKWSTEIKRKEMEDFCFKKVTEIIKVLSPKKILVIGFGTYKELQKSGILNFTNEKIVCKRNKNNQTLAMISNTNDIEFFTTIHLSGARFSNEDFNKIGSSFSEFLLKK